MRKAKLTKKQKETLRSYRWFVFERSLLECQTIIHVLMNQQGTTLEQRQRLVRLRRRVKDAFIAEATNLGWQTQPYCFNPRKARTRLSIEA